MNLALYPHLLARSEPGRPAIEQNGLRVTYGEFEITSRRIAHRLRRAGLRGGDICALILRDDILHLAALFAIWRLGAVLLPLDWRLQPAEAARVVARFGPRLVLATGSFRLPGDVETVHLDSHQDESDADLAVEPVEDEAALYALSSGTTGEPKAAIITHRQHEARVMAYAASYPILPSDRYFSTLPIAYNWGRNLAVSHLCLGATLILHPTLFSPVELVAAVEQTAATTMAAVPNVSRALLRLPVAERPLMGGLRRYFSSTAPLFPEERAQIRARIAPNLAEMYGTTETGGLCVLPPGDQDRAPGSVGRPAIGVEIELVGEDNQPLASGEVGRIRCRGPGVIDGYLNGTPADAERFQGGWYYTGDHGNLDAEGYVYIDGRSTEVIKRAGMTVHASEIERVLRAHSAVAEAAVVGVPSSELGEDIEAFVVLREAVDMRLLINHCRISLAAFKQPRLIRPVSSLPRNAAGKVLKSELTRSRDVRGS
jgi:long-chain acyl-CoA synthetase